MRIEIPEFAMVAIIGTSGSGKSTFCKRHFLPTEVLSSDTYRGYLCDDEDSLEVTPHAFEALHFMLRKRLELGRLTVVDATNVQKEARAGLMKIANEQHALKVAIVMDVPEQTCHDRNALRPNRQFGPHVVRNQRRSLREFFGTWKKEGWTKVYFVKPEDADKVEIVRTPLYSRKPKEHGPFDIIGDIHGCIAELKLLLTELGWSLEPELSHPDGRKIILLGDIVDRGPDSLACLRFAMEAVRSGKALWVPGNHDIKMMRAIKSEKVSRTHGLAETMAQIEALSKEEQYEIYDFVHDLTSHYLLDDGKLCVAHAGMLEEMQGRGSGAVREFALYGETTGEIDEFGLPVRYPWAESYRGKALVIYGHTPVPEAVWVNGTMDIDTGCVFGGKLTAFRYPERTLVSVDALDTYATPARPIDPPSKATFESLGQDTLLDVSDVLGKRFIECRLSNRIRINEENAIAALEVMSRFAADPRWLIYLPPTMSPCKTSDRDGFLEYPTEAFDYFREIECPRVICQEKHMGSRAVIVICDNEATAQKRFGVDPGEIGIITTRTGRRFFEDLAVERQLLERVQKAISDAGLWEELGSPWLLLDVELMPWSAKAVGLLREQYAPVGVSSMASMRVWSEVLNGAESRGVSEIADLREAADRKQASAQLFVDAYRRYCWSVNSIDDYKIAPFHLMASEGAVHIDKNHLWHMETLAKMCAQDPQILRQTPYRVVDLADETSVSVATQWWEELVLKGGEGMVVKPIDFVFQSGGRVHQPAIKCRGPEYLRIIYGPDYLAPENMERLRKRGLNRKRGLASREFALGIEALERFVRNDPLRKVHECVFGVLAMESEPVDPRL